jgi:nucleotide-binding universal stress UspA family protein
MDRMAPYRRILVAVDGSEASRQALAAALQLAKDAGGRVCVLHDISDLQYLVPYADPGALLEAARSGGEQVLRDALALCESAGVPADTRLVDAPGRPLGEAVADEARAWKADLVVLGSHGRRGLQRLLLGSGAEQILRLSPVPTLVVRKKPPA